MPWGHSLDQYLGALFEQKEKFTVYLSGKGNHYFIQTQHDFFPLITFFLQERKIGPKSAPKYCASISDRAHAPPPPWASRNTP